MVLQGGAEEMGIPNQATVDKLHAIEVVWGDPKPGNVVIDLYGDAW